jgi:hypothetical protein
MVLIIALTAVGDAGDRHFSTESAASLNQISGFIYNDHFVRAEQLIDSLDQSGSQAATGRLFRVILYQSQMMAAESNYLNDEYFAALDSLESAARRLLDRGSDSALACFYLGHAHAFRSLYHGHFGGLLKALKSGLAARKAYSRGYEIDSTFHDLALGLGSYRYWKSVKTEAINWTPLFKDEKSSGIELLRLAADSSEISQDAASASLIWVYINEERYAEAIRLATAMRQKYPEGLTFLWGLGEAYFRMEDCRSAVDIYETILARLRHRPGNYYNFVQASYFLSECYRRLIDSFPDMTQRLASLQNEIETSPIPDDTRKRQKKNIKRILDNR